MEFRKGGKTGEKLMGMGGEGGAQKESNPMA